MRILCLLALPLLASAAQPWREVTVPAVAEVEAAWKQPPAEYGAIHWAIWGGQQSKERIAADIEHIAANGGGVYMINNSRGMLPKYFTPEYLDLVKFTVEQCKRHGLKVWIEDDAGYPSGMAGGLIRRDHPELGMQAIVADVRYTVAAGQTLSIPLPPDTLGILAYNRSTRTSSVVPMPADGTLRWLAPNPGMSELVFVRHVYRSSPTRYTNREDGTNDKDSYYTLIDYLDPEATRVYLNLIHETYVKLLGNELGTTVLGFRGDEPDYTGFMPWTPKLLATFKQVKGYDLQPYIPQFFAVELTPEARRAKADYWDVWSALFRDAFFKPQQDWCAAHGMEYMTHLNHEELMLDLSRGEDLIRNQGSFFRDMRYVGLPGIDNLSQIRPGVVADFPKLASSAAHLYGRPQVWTEQGGSVGPLGKFTADYQFVRGINYLNVSGLQADPAVSATALMDRPGAMGRYVSRASYLLSLGRPAAQVALFHPTDSLWLGDEDADKVTVRLTTQLMERQIDFDDIDTDTLVSVCTLADGGLKNLSGQVYRAIVIPSCTVISRAMLERLQTLAKAGVKVVFVGRTPTLVYDRSFLAAKEGAPDLSFATLLEAKPEITDAVAAVLPKDFSLDTPSPAIKYLHRSLRDAEVYFVFNESAEPQTRTVTVQGRGQVQIWDAARGEIHPLEGIAPAAGEISLPLVLQSHESRFIVIGTAAGSAMTPFPTLASRETRQSLNDGWSVTLGDNKLTTDLKPWQQMNAGSFTGVAEYERTFAAPAASAGRRTYLDLGHVNEVARVQLNGRDLGARDWPPYVWDITDTLKPGENTLVVKVQVPQETGRRGPGGYGARPSNAGGNESRTIAPTGVPGGLATDALAVTAPRRAPEAGAGTAAAARSEPAASGLLGPVRIVSP